MFFNTRDNPEERPERREPRSVFARVDRIEETEGEQATVIFDCIDADWIEEQQPDSLPIAARVGDEGQDIDGALSILAIEVHGMRIAGQALAESQWYFIELGMAAQGEFDVDQYDALFSDPNPRGVISILPVSEDLKEKLNHLAGWAEAEHSGDNEIKAALAVVQKIDAIGIYDVGQGAATALLSDGSPRMYFDFGGSAIGNWRSFPLHLRMFCFTYCPPIVLSHWDWDHWSSALRDRQALRATWILPLQKRAGSLGPVHARFLAMLRKNAKILWWDPNVLLQMNVGITRARVIQALGNPLSRNESGLAVVVDPGCGRERTALLPGDASYANLRSQAGADYYYTMVPHHGGKIDLSSLPAPATKSTSQAIYSYGVGNIFLHPRAETVKAFRQRYKKNTHCALRNSTGFGHVGLDLTGGRLVSPYLPCCGACQLAVQQWI